jgi:hypothetical protein
LNVTVTEARSDGFATVFPPGSTVPNASNLNFRAGDTVPNAVITRLGSDGTICVFASAGTHLIVDVAGYLASAGAAAPTSGCPGPPSLPRSGVDRPDDLTGHQVHLVYALPSDGPDRSFDTDGSIARSINLVQDWLSGQTGGQRLRLDTYGGQPDVTFVRLAKTDEYIASFEANVREMVERGLSDAGQIHPDKIYLVYYDGTSTFACGGASYPPYLIGQAQVLYLRGLPAGPVTCGSNTLGALGATAPAYFDIAMLHEFTHGLGLVPLCAPHQYLGGHASDAANDLMWTGNQPWDVAHVTIDVNRDDYYGHGRADCPDMQTSAFLSPTVGPTWLPSGWGSTPASQAPQYA